MRINIYTNTKRDSRLGTTCSFIVAGDAHIFIKHISTNSYSIVYSMTVTVTKRGYQFGSSIVENSRRDFIGYHNLSVEDLAGKLLFSLLV